jgi:hypothetical protein
MHSGGKKVYINVATFAGTLRIQKGWSSAGQSRQ